MAGLEVGLDMGCWKPVRGEERPPIAGLEVGLDIGCSKPGRGWFADAFVVETP